MKFSTVVDEYVKFKRALGREFTTEIRILAAFCRYVGDIQIDIVTKKQVQDYLDGDVPISSYWKRKHTALIGLFRFALSRGYSKVSPFPIRYPICPPPLVPYIYSQLELKRLLVATPSVCGRQVPMDAYVLRTVILVLYGACLRINEALSLTVGDVDLVQSLLCIRKTKFFKTRLVPIGKDLKQELCKYTIQRDITHCNETAEPFFCFQDGRPLSQSSVRNAFHRLCVKTGTLRDDGGRYQPRLHDLRHTGVIHRLIAWYREGADLQKLLPQLATYLGHINLTSTQHYLTITPELMKEASQRFESYTKENHHE